MSNTFQYLTWRFESSPRIGGRVLLFLIERKIFYQKWPPYEDTGGHEYQSDTLTLICKVLSGHCLIIFRLQFSWKFHWSQILYLSIFEKHKKKNWSSLQRNRNIVFSTHCTLHRRFHTRLLAPHHYRCPYFYSQSKFVPLTVLHLMTYDTRHCATIAGNDADIWPRTRRSEACTCWLQRVQVR